MYELIRVAVEGECIYVTMGSIYIRLRTYYHGCTKEESIDR